MLAGEGTRLKVIREKVFDLNRTGNKKPLLRLFLAIFIIFSLSGGVWLHFKRNAPKPAGGLLQARPPAGQQVSARRSVAQLRQSALKRASAAPVTNNVSPFVSTLGPKATSYLGSMAALRELPAVLSSNQIATLRALVSEPYSPSCLISPLEFNGVQAATSDECRFIAS